MALQLARCTALESPTNLLQDARSYMEALCPNFLAYQGPHVSLG